MSERTSQLYDKRESETFYDERFKGGYMDEWPPEKKQRVLDVIRGLGLPSSGEALDFGCGNGVFTEIIQLALPEWRVHGMDFSSVAIQAARARYPKCIFFTPSNRGLMSREYDFLFTHHVLEHVYDLDEVWQNIVGFMKRSSSALHILPCGNEGSFEHSLCQLRVDGIDHELEGRFFFEDEGHVRRLNTDQMRALAARSGLELAGECYSNQYHGSIEWVTGSGRDFVHTLTDPDFARDPASRATLARIRIKLKAITWARSLVVSTKFRRKNPNKGWSQWVALAVRLPFFPICNVIDRHTRRRAEAEWEHRKHDRGGSEMYLHFKR